MEQQQIIFDLMKMVQELKRENEILKSRLEKTEFLAIASSNLPCFSPEAKQIAYQRFSEIMSDEQKKANIESAFIR